MPHARPRRGADDLGQERLGRGVAVQDVVLAALLVVDDELDGDARASGPVGERGSPPVADHVARIGFALSHVALPPRVRAWPPPPQRYDKTGVRSSL